MRESGPAPAPLAARGVLVTGCASGIGRHLAGVLAARGDRVLATDVNEAGLSAAAREDGWPNTVRLCVLDVRSAESWDAAVARAVTLFGTLDVLIHAAGVLRPGGATSVTPADVDLHLDVNAKGTILGTRAAAARMVKQGAGHIVNFASLAALAPVPGLSLYAASKFAVRGFSLSAAEELRHHGVAVTVICPDAVQTPMLDLQVDYPEAALTFSGPRPLTVDEVGRAVIEVVLLERPLELTLPRSRGLVAKLASAFPALAFRLAPLLARRGRARQARLRG